MCSHSMSESKWNGQQGKTSEKETDNMETDAKGGGGMSIQEANSKLNYGGKKNATKACKAR